METNCQTRPLPPFSAEDLLRAAFKYQDALTSYAYALLQDWALAQGAVQETFILLQKKHAEFWPGANVFTWARQMVRYEALNILRARGREYCVADEELLALVDAQFEEHMNPDALARLKQQKAALQHCMTRLASDTLNLILGFYRERLSCDQLATARQRTVNAIRLFALQDSRALARLRAKPSGAGGGGAMKREELFDKHLRGQLSAAETAELKELLATDADAGRAFVEHTTERTLLVRVGSQLQASRPAENVVAFPAADGRVSQVPDLAVGGEAGAGVTRPFKVWRWAALAACLVALVATAALLFHSSNCSPVAEVRLAGPGVQVTRGGALMDADEVELQAGDIIVTPTNIMAVIVYQREATRIEIKANSVVQFGDDRGGKRFDLRCGALQARVAAQPADQPLVVTTPQAQATVLGTEFLLRADERATKLNALEGKVQLACRTSAKGVVVEAGFSATSTSSGTSVAKPLCKCPKCRGTNNTACPNQKRKNEN